MIKTLVVQETNHKRNISHKLAYLHEDWDVIEADDYESAKQCLQDGSVDALAVASDVPSSDTISLVDSLMSKNPDANVYVIMEPGTSVDLSKCADRGFIYA